MSRDFILVFSGGVVSLMTTLVVLFVMDYLYRREQRNKVDQPSQSARGSEAANKNVAIQAPVAKDSDHQSVVIQTAKGNQAELTARQPAVERPSRTRADESPIQKPSSEQRPSSSASETVTVSPVVDVSDKPKLDDQSLRKPEVEPKPEPKAEEKSAPIIVDQASKPHIDEHLAEKPVVEVQPEAKTAESTAQEPGHDQKSQAAAAEAKPRPPHTVPPEKIKKKTREANAAGAASKEHDG